MKCRSKYSTTGPNSRTLRSQLMSLAGGGSMQSSLFPRANRGFIREIGFSQSRKRSLGA
jgi:hypothetical protein